MHRNINDEWVKLTCVCVFIKRRDPPARTLTRQQPITCRLKRGRKHEAQLFFSLPFLFSFFTQLQLHLARRPQVKPRIKKQQNTTTVSNKECFLPGSSTPTWFCFLSVCVLSSALLYCFNVAESRELVYCQRVRIN